jgi:VanZ family protein
MPSFIRSLTASLPLLFWCALALVTYLMLIELPPKNGGWPYWDKVQHLLVFVMLTSLAFMAYRQWKWMSVALLIIYGAVIEWLQAMLTLTRMASFGDWLADVAGVLLTLMLSILMVRLFPRNGKI